MNDHQQVHEKIRHSYDESLVYQAADLLKMLRKRASLSSKDSKGTTKNEELLASQAAEQLAALRDLHSTYAHPIKCSYPTHFKRIHQSKNITSTLKQRELGLINFHRYPNARHQTMDRPTFCGQFSVDGQRFFSACQDQHIRLFNTSTSQTFDRLAEISLDDVGWSILDTALSPDRKSIAYSTWSECIYLINIDENEDQRKITPLYLRPEAHSFSIFSLQYSDDGSEIIGGSNDRHVYIYDLQKRQRTLRVRAHNDDVNAVRFIDNSNSLIVSGSDDNLVSVWDRRALKESQPKPVGIFAGHSYGITFVHSRMDTRYLISNSKDQSIKLWDMRRFADESTVKDSRATSRNMDDDWDYRYEMFHSRAKTHEISGDPSVRTYRGHSVACTLIRCYFSPSFTTGQKYIISGSADGCIRIYDVLTGDIKLCLRVSNHRNETRERCVRDVSWHPHENCIISTSWDHRRSHVRWIYSSDELTVPPSNASNEPKTISFQTPNSPRQRRATTLRGLLMRQFLGHQSDSNSDDDVSALDD